MTDHTTHAARRRPRLLGLALLTALLGSAAIAPAADDSRQAASYVLTEQRPGTGTVESQHRRLVRMRTGVHRPRCARSPAARHVLDDPSDRARAGFIGAEVPGGLRGSPAHQRLGQEQLAVDRVEDVLPGADRVRIADHHGFAV